MHSRLGKVVRRVGLVFQNPEMQFFEYYVGDEIAYGPRQLKVEEPLRERVRWAMEHLGLDFDTYKDRPLFTLSGGERRKVALASTLALKPDILLLGDDEAAEYIGSQFLDSPATGRYHTYLCDEVVPWVDAHYPTLPRREHRDKGTAAERDRLPGAVPQVPEAGRAPGHCASQQCALERHL